MGQLAAGRQRRVDAGVRPCCRVEPGKQRSNANSNTPTAPGVTGLFGLTAELDGPDVELFATSYGLNELSPSFLYEITDVLRDVDHPGGGVGETFTTLDAAPAGTLIRGVSFAPVDTPEPASLALFGPLACRRWPI